MADEAQALVQGRGIDLVEPDLDLLREMGGHAAVLTDRVGEDLERQLLGRGGEECVGVDLDPEPDRERVLPGSQKRQQQTFSADRSTVGPLQDHGDGVGLEADQGAGADASGKVLGEDGERNQDEESGCNSGDSPRALRAHFLVASISTGTWSVELTMLTSSRIEMPRIWEPGRMASFVGQAAAVPLAARI